MIDLDSKWYAYFSDIKVGVDYTTTTHQTKSGIVKDGFNSKW